MADPLSRRTLLASAAALSLGACAGTRRSSAFWSTVTGTRSKADIAETRAYADRLPYASMLFWLDGQPQSLIVLGSVDPADRLTWYTADKQAITTYGPFIVATAGMDVELVRTDFAAGWSTDLRALVGKTLDRETITANDGEAKSRLRSTFRPGASETVTILGRSLVLQRIDETVVADRRVRLLNSYWIDPATGACHKSRQQALPTMQPVNIEMLKFAAQPA